MHIGRLTCDGDDMLNSSESTTIEEFLKKYKPRQFRFFCLLNSWSSNINYDRNQMEQAINYESTIKEFLENIQQLLNSNGESNNMIDCCAKLVEDDVKLFEQFQRVKQNIYLVLNDSMNTEGVLKIIHGLILEVQDYVSRKTDQVNIYLLKLIRDYVIDLMNIFGVSFTDN